MPMRLSAHDSAWLDRYKQEVADQQAAVTTSNETQGPAHADTVPWESPVPLIDVPKAVLFPLDVLPKALALFVHAIAAATNSPLDYAAVLLLTIAGAAIGAARSLQIKAGWAERPCLFSALIGPPGSAKTPAAGPILAPVYAEQARRLAAYRRQRVGWEENDAEDKGPPPKLETIFVEDITIEKLASILQDNPRGVVVVRDELTAWIGSMDMYRGKGKGADRQAYLSVWAGKPIRVDRKGEEDPVYVPHPFVGVTGGLCPDLLPRLRGERDIQDGFLDRVLLSYPEPVPAKGEDWRCIDDEAAAAWERTLAQLWALQPEMTEDGETRPHFVRLTSDASSAWEEFTGGLARELNRDDLPEPLKGHLSKFKGYGARLALILHCLRQVCGEADGEDVDGESMERASRLISYFGSHALKVHAALGSDPEIEDARRVLDWIRREKPTTFKRYDVFEDVKNKDRFPRIEDLDRPLSGSAKGF
jgi:hypothetical protein